MTRGFRVRAGGRRPLRALDAATGDRGVAAQRAGALERAALVLADFQQALAEVEGRMAKALEELGLAELVISIRGLSVVGAATILAETGDPLRRRQSSGQARRPVPRTTPWAPLPARPPSPGRGRPLLRLAAWRAVWGALSHNPWSPPAPPT
jgi:transposase